jgi:hypothetical protein
MLLKQDLFTGSSMRCPARREVMAGTTSLAGYRRGIALGAALDDGAHDGPTTSVSLGWP